MKSSSMKSNVKASKISSKKSKSVKIVTPDDEKRVKGNRASSSKKGNASSGKKKPSSKPASPGKKVGRDGVNGNPPLTEADAESQNATDGGGNAVQAEEVAKEVVPMKMLLARFFCCLCFLPKNRRKLRRKEIPAAVVEVAPPDPAPAPELQPPDPKRVAAVKIQRIVRGILGRARAQKCWEEVMYEANEYWFEKLRQIVLERWRIREEIAARKRFTRQYVSDVIETSVAFVSQVSEASTMVQKVWRGYRIRKMNLLYRPPKKTRRPIPRVLKSRFKTDTLRRVWVRRNFEPGKNGSGPPGKKKIWLHTTDFGHLDYDMWEHIESPPPGDIHGLRTRKTKIIPESDRKLEVLLGDRHAWVGLPVGMETWEEAKARYKAEVPQFIQEFIASSPFSQKLWLQEQSPNEVIHVAARAAAATKGLDIDDIVEGGAGEAARETGYDLASRNGGDDSNELYGYGHSDSKAQIVRSSRHPSMILERYSAHATGTENRNEKQRERRAQNRLLKAQMAQHGYDERTMDPILRTGRPRIGHLSYDSRTGRHIMHKGNNTWVGVNDPTFVVQYEDKRDWDEIPLNSGYSLMDTSASELFDTDLLASKPHVFEHKSGAVSVTNPSLHRLLRTHRQEFIDTFINYRIGDVLNSKSGLIGRESQQQTWTTQSVPGVDFEDSDFRFVATAQRMLEESSLNDHSLAGERIVTATQESSASELFQGTRLTTGNGAPMRGARKARPGIQYPNTASGKFQKQRTVNEKQRKAFMQSSPSVDIGDSNPSTADENMVSKEENALKIWRESPWGKVKAKVEDIAAATSQNEVLSNRLYNVVTGAVAAAKTNNYTALNEYDVLDGQFDEGDEADAASMYATSNADSEAEMWEQRRLYHPKKSGVAKVVVWANKPKQTYKLRYNWIPQPLLHNAVNNIYYSTTMEEFYAQSQDRKEDADFREIIKEQSFKSVRAQQQRSMTMLVTQADFDQSARFSSRKIDNRPNDMGGVLDFGPSNRPRHMIPSPRTAVESGAGSVLTPTSSIASPTQIKYDTNSLHTALSLNSDAAEYSTAAASDYASPQDRQRPSPQSSTAIKKTISFHGSPSHPAALSVGKSPNSSASPGRLSKASSARLTSPWDPLQETATKSLLSAPKGSVISKNSVGSIDMNSNDKPSPESSLKKRAGSDKWPGGEAADDESLAASTGSLELSDSVIQSGSYRDISHTTPMASPYRRKLMEKQERIDESIEDGVDAEKEVLNTLLRTSSAASVMSNHYLSPVQRAADSPIPSFSPAISRAQSMRGTPIHDEIAAHNADAHTAAAFLQQSKWSAEAPSGSSVPSSAANSPKQNYAPKFKFKPAVLKRGKSEAIHPYHWL